MSGFFSFGRDSVEAIQPTRDHWVPDAKAIFCAISGCGRAFSLLERRHHCRRFLNFLFYFMCCIILFIIFWQLMFE